MTEFVAHLAGAYMSKYGTAPSVTIIREWCELYRQGMR